GFLYKLETEGALDGDIATLSPYEIASRVSYLTTGSMPDDSLLEAAASGALSTGDQITAHASRLIDSAKGQAHVKTFLNQWAHVEGTANFDYTASFRNGINTANLRQDAVKEIEGFLEYIALKKEGDFRDLMTSQEGVGVSTELAKVYGVSANPNGTVDLGSER